MARRPTIINMTFLRTVAKQGTRKLKNKVFLAMKMQQSGEKNGSQKNVLETQASPADEREFRSPRFSQPIGSRPLDGYTIKRGVGAGGFGEVYYAKSDGGKDVALKCVQRNLDIELRGVRQCLNIKHPNLLALYDIKHDDQDQVWVIMEYVAGDSLQAVVERNPHGLPLDEVARWFDGIAAGTAHLHECGIVHRDLKPANLFMEDGAVKIGDYGLSKFISCSRRSAQTQSVGTFHYMAPEIGQGRYGREIDIYALGIILYEMLTGTVPFDGESSQEIIMKHLTAQPPMDAIPVPFRSVLAQALAKDPQDRFHTLDEMRQAFRQALDGSGALLGVASAAPTASASPIPDAPLAAATLAAARAAQQAFGSVAQHARVPNEPLAQAAVAAGRELARGFQDSNLGAVPKLVIVVAGVVMIIVNAAWIFPFVGSLALGYGIYLGVRSVLLHRTAKPSHAWGTRQRQRHEANLVRRQQRRRRPIKLQPVHMRQHLAEKTLSTRSTELLSSLLQSAAVASLFSLAIALSIEHSVGLYTWVTNFVWLALSSTVASWSVLILAKGWETSSGDHFIRRIWTGLTGVLTGVFSYALAHVLLFQPTYVLPDLQVMDFDKFSTLHEPNGMPKLQGFMVFFGLLFMAMRWWRQADPTRRFRLSLLGTVFTILMTMLLQMAVPLPQGFLIAGVTTVAVQMSAPWLSNVERDEMRNKLIHDASPEVA